MYISLTNFITSSDFGSVTLTFCFFCAGLLAGWLHDLFDTSDKICMMTTRLACNRAIESSYWRMDNDSDVGLLTGYVLYRLPVELEFMDLDIFPR
jgi:hypothetical protein